MKLRNNIMCLKYLSGCLTFDGESKKIDVSLKGIVCGKAKKNWGKIDVLSLFIIETT